MPIEQLKKHGMTAEEAFLWLWRSVRQGCCLVNPVNHMFEAVNPYLCELWGYTEGELQERTFEDITVPGDLKADKKELKRLINGEVDSYVMTKSYITKNGQVRTMDLYVIPILNEQGVVSLLFSQVNLPLDRGGNVNYPMAQPSIPVKPAKNWKTWLYEHAWKIIIGLAALGGWLYSQGQEAGRAEQQSINQQQTIQELSDTIKELQLQLNERDRQ